MSYYDSSYFNNPTVTTVTSNISGQLIWIIIASVLALVGGITLYFTIFNKKNEEKYKGFMSIIYNLVHFKYFVIEDIFRIMYIISVLFVTLYSFSFIGKWQFLLILVGGNIIIRIIYEFVMLFIELCHNVRNISSKTKK